MSQSRSKTETMLIVFPMFIATISVVSSLYQAYLFSKSVEIAQRNVVRAEVMRTCREAIDVFFSIKTRVGSLAGAGGTGAPDPEAAALVGRFGALGTFLANLSKNEEDTRVRYTELSRELERLIGDARNIARSDLEKSFTKADQLFTGMNEDCIRSSQAVM
jgi:hypothetical protein